MRPLLAVWVAALATLCLAPSGLAFGGSYAFDGGTRLERQQVRSALAASSFDFSALPGSIQVHIVPGAWPHATPGEVWLDPSLLQAGEFSWAVVQDEFAHQLDFLVLSDADRAVLARALGTEVWCHADDPRLVHSAYGCERFTSTFVWSYWQAPANTYRPDSSDDESAALPPARFRSLVDGLVARRLPVLFGLG